MSSDRPESSAAPRSESFETHPENQNQSLPVIGDHFAPNVFDVIFLTHRARDTAKAYIPPIFFQNEAVDSSHLLGHGASFIVTRQEIPPVPPQIKAKTNLEGFRVERVSKLPKRPRYIVYKSARVRFNEDGDTTTLQDRRALESLLTEFHALLHPPFLKHENIIDFLGLAWGSNHANPLHQLPVLVVEYGDLGTLADVQKRQFLTSSLKLDLCLGIARGLEMLHAHGVIHGDIKPENIIMCSHTERTMIPKLADFGFAIIEATELPHVRIGGTRLWRAPESYSSIFAPHLKLTDVYSFGLLTWSVAMDGKDPFTFVLGDRHVGEERFKEIDRLKFTDEIVSLSRLENWTLEWAMEDDFLRLREVLANLRVKHPKTALKVGQESRLFEWLQNELLSETAPFSSNPLLRKWSVVVTDFFCANPLFKDLPSLFAATLGKDPSSRDLRRVIKLLDPNDAAYMARKMQNYSIGRSLKENDRAKEERIYRKPKASSAATIANKVVRAPIFARASAAPTTFSQSDIEIKPETVLGKADWAELGFKKHRFSWQIVRDLEPRVQNFAVKTMLHAEHGTREFSLAAFFFNGYGVQVDEEQGLKILVENARNNHPIAQAYLYRMFVACSKELPQEIPILQYLKTQAQRGSRMALEDLNQVNPDEAAEVRWKLRFGYGGVGADWFSDDHMLHGLNAAKLMNDEFLPESLGQRLELGNIIVNKRGDNLIHVAAAVGAFGLLRKLVTEFQLDVNQCNKEGETALLCACRSGHPGNVQVLLDHGAVASIQALNGESPLHWLLSFDDTKIDPAKVGIDLIQRGGANVDAFTTRNISHSMFPGTIDVDHQQEGTPLMWAVHNNRPHLVRFLLSVGADPKWRRKTAWLSPLEWAAFFHHHECLQIIIEHLENRVIVPYTGSGERDIRHAVYYTPLVKCALHASDKYSMILRNGANYFSMLMSTLGLLQKKTELITFNLGANLTPLHYAAREAHDEACKAILELQWFPTSIVLPCDLGEIFERGCETDRAVTDARPGEATELLESVRWNRPHLYRLLVENGANGKALSTTPFEPNEQPTWSALHVMANQGHNDDLSLVDYIMTTGLPVDGDPEVETTETPFNIAVRRNAFRLADKLRNYGADPDALRIRSGLSVSPYQLTVLGHEIARNSPHGLAAMRYLLALHPKPSFVVAARDGLTALHLVALVPDGFKYVGGGELDRDDFDWEANQLIAHELLCWFTDQVELDACCSSGKTALLMAAERGNLGVVEELVKAGASVAIASGTGETPAETVKKLFNHRDQDEMRKKLLEWLE